MSGGGKKQTINPLKLATPISYMGGRSLATKDKFVIHITIKEECNVPLPKDPHEDLVLWRIGKNVNYDIETLAETNGTEYKHRKGIPLFWEPADQTNDETKVQYCGHWRISNVKFEQRTIMKQPRCGKMTFKFDRYDENFSKIIATASKMEVTEIVDHDWNSALGKPHEQEVTDSASVATDEKPVATTTAKNEVDESHGESSQGVPDEPPPKQEQVATKTEHESSTNNKKRKAGACRKSDHSRKRETTVTDEMPDILTAAPEHSRRNNASKQHSSRKRCHSQDSTKNKRATAFPNPAAAARTVVAAARTAAPTAAPTKGLSKFTKHELAELIASKGKKFEPVAMNLKDADFNGKAIVEQLELGDTHFKEFLRRYCGLENMLCRMSLIRTLREHLNE